MPQEVNITKADEVFTGCDKVLQFTVLDAADVAVNITAWGLKWIFCTRPVPPAGATLLLTKTTGSPPGVTIITPASGILQVAIADIDTDDLIGDMTYYHELRRTDAANEDVLAYGTFYLRQSPVK